MAVLRDVAPCSLVGTAWRFRVAYCLHQGDDGDSKLLWNVGQLANINETWRQPFGGLASSPGQWICGGQSGTVTVFSPESFDFILSVQLSHQDSVLVSGVGEEQ
jgi:hypothetical protein